MAKLSLAQQKFEFIEANAEEINDFVEEEALAVFPPQRLSNSWPTGMS